VVGANFWSSSSEVGAEDYRRGDVLNGAYDVSSLEALGPLGKIELDRFALVQAAVSVFLDRREMNENILARGPLNESVALGPVKPLDCTFLSHNLLLST
jgi:hypothetical protein